MAIEREIQDTGRHHPQAPMVHGPGPSAGFVAQAPLRPAAGPLLLPAAAGVVVMPDAGGPGAPGLLALLALWLAGEGIEVLVHRPGASDAAAGAAAVLASLGIAPARGADDIADHWSRREPALVSTGLLVRAGAAGDAAWRLAAPRGPAGLLRVVPCDDAPSALRAGSWAARTASNVVVLTGSFGVDSLPGPRAEVWVRGRPLPVPRGAAADELPSGRAPWPRDAGAAATAVLVQQVLSGERPMPGPVLALARRIAATRALLG